MKHNIKTLSAAAAMSFGISGVVYADGKSSINAWKNPDGSGAWGWVKQSHGNQRSKTSRWVVAAGGKYWVCKPKTVGKSYGQGFENPDGSGAMGWVKQSHGNQTSKTSRWVVAAGGEYWVCKPS